MADFIIDEHFSKEDAIAIQKDILNALAQYDSNRAQFNKSVTEAIVTSRDDEVPRYVNEDAPRNAAEAQQNIVVDIASRRRQLRQATPQPATPAFVEQAVGSVAPVGNTTPTPAFREAVSKAARSKKVEWVDRPVETKPGKANISGKDIEYKLVRKYVDWGTQLSTDPEQYIDNIDKIRKLISKDVRSQFGSWERITSVVIMGGQLILNNVMYVPVIQPEYFNRFPLDIIDHIQGGCIAPLFDFRNLKSMSRLRSFVCDDKNFYVTELADDLGLGRRIGVSSLFNICPQLEEITIGQETLRREELYTPKSKAIKDSVRQTSLYNRLTDNYKINVYAGTDGFQNFAFSNLRNYATNRGDKNIFRYCFGTATLLGLAATAGVLNLGAHLVGGVSKTFMGMWKTATTPVTEQDIT